MFFYNIHKERSSNFLKKLLFATRLRRELCQDFFIDRKRDATIVESQILRAQLLHLLLN